MCLWHELIHCSVYCALSTCNLIHICMCLTSTWATFSFSWKSLGDCELGLTSCPGLTWPVAITSRLLATWRPLSFPGKGCRTGNLLVILLGELEILSLATPPPQSGEPRKGLVLEGMVWNLGLSGTVRVHPTVQMRCWNTTPRAHVCC